MNKKLAAMLILAALLAPPQTNAGDDRPAKPTDSVPSWKEAVESPMLAHSYPGWTPPPIMDYPFSPPEKVEKSDENKICLTVAEARELVRLLNVAAQQEAQLELAYRNLESATKRINFLELQNYEIESNFKELQKQYLKTQDDLRKAEALIEELAPK